MFRPALPLLLTLILGAGINLFLPPPGCAQQLTDRVISEHIRVRIPTEREWFGRDAVVDLERCWQFMNRSIGAMPRRVLIVVTWDNGDTTTEYENGTIRIGMGQPAAASDPKFFLLHSGGREMARLGLLGLSEGRANREESRFLLEGMSELLVHEYEASNRNIEGAWVIAHMLEGMKRLGFAQQAQWPALAGARHSLMTAAPGATLLITCRELHGRDSLFKLFDFLKRSNLQEALSAAFKSSQAVLESTWLQKVRDYDVTRDVTATTAEDAPSLETMTAVGSSGSSLHVHLYLKDRVSNLLPEGIFVLDTASGQTLQAQAGSEGADRFFAVDVPIESDRRAGAYELVITAVDESGNVRTWKKSYSLK
jgi:hypothetical protein